MINDETLLIDIVENNSNYVASRDAAARVRNQNLLIDWAKNHDNYGVRVSAVRNISADNQPVLIGLAKNNEDYRTRYEAIYKLTDISALKDLVQNDPDEDMRNKAKERLKDLGYE